MQDTHMRHVMCRAQLAVTLHSPASGRYMDLYTNMPGLQFYSGNNLNGSPWARAPTPTPSMAEWPWKPRWAAPFGSYSVALCMVTCPKV